MLVNAVTYDEATYKFNDKVPDLHWKGFKHTLAVLERHFQGPANDGRALGESDRKSLTLSKMTPRLRSRLVGEKAPRSHRPGNLAYRTSDQPIRRARRI